MSYYEAAFRHGEPLFSRTEDVVIASLEGEISTLRQEIDSLKRYVDWLLAYYEQLEDDKMNIPSGTAFFQ